MQQQLSLLDSILDLFVISPLSILGLLFLLVSLHFSLVNASWKQKLRVSLASCCLYFFWVIALTNIFGTPSLAEFFRLHDLDEKIFNLNIEWGFLADGFSRSFILNILIFMPMGFLAPWISPVFQKLKNTCLLVFCASLAIELSQLFTLYRATDINDLLANTFGGVCGFACYWLLAKIFTTNKESSPANPRYLPIMILILGGLVTFF